MASAAISRADLRRLLSGPGASKAGHFYATVVSLLGTLPSKSTHGTNVEDRDVDLCLAPSVVGARCRFASCGKVL